MQRVALDKSILQRGELAAFGRALDGLHREPVGLHREQQAAAHDPALHAHSARAAYPMLATYVRAGKAEILAQKIHEIAPHRDAA